MILSAEKMKIAGQAKDVNELMRLAKENGFEMTEGSAGLLFAHMRRKGELTDEEIGSISGGKNWNCIYSTSLSIEDVKYRFEIGAHVQVITSVGWLSEHVYTTGADIINRMAAKDATLNGYIAYYQLSGGEYTGQWVPEYDLEGGYEYIVNTGLW